MSLHELSAVELIDQLNSQQLSAIETTEHFLNRIQSLDPSIHAFRSVDADGARSAARSIDERRSRGEEIGLLGGLPVAIKDVLCQEGIATTCGSKILENYHPPYSATAIEKVMAADGVIIGRTNMDEFAMGSSTENSAYGVTRNPWDKERIPGGSSGGAAAAVAARLVPLSLGTDTGGSIRQPAGLCGVSGLKPTYGRVSRYGLVAFASSLDQIGPLANSAEDAALLLEVISGHDPRDSTSSDKPGEAYSSSVSKPLEGLRLGVVGEHFGDGLDSEIGEAVKSAIEVFRNLGATITDISLPHSKYGIATYYIIAPAEASSNLARYDGVHYGYRTDEEAMRKELAREREQAKAEGRSGDDVDSLLVRMYRRTRAEGFGAEVKRRVMLGTYTLSQGYYDKYYVKAQKVRRLIRQDYDAAFENVDLIIGPVTASTAFRIGDKADDPLAMYLEDLYTVTANLAGIAGISIPCGFSSDNLPIGLQLQSPPFAEDRLLRAAHMYQQQTDWHRKQPNLT